MPPYLTNTGSFGTNVDASSLPGIQNTIQQYTQPTATPQDTTSTNTPTGATGTGTGTGTGTSSAWNSYWQALAGQIDDALGRIPTQGQIGHQNILDAFNSAFSTLTNQKGQADRDYGTNVANTQNDNIFAKNNIATGVRNGLTGLQRLLGANGAGSSSAYEVLAPYAAGYEGNQERQQVNNSFGRNMGALDTAHADTNNNFDTAFGQLNTDRTNKDRGLDSSLDQTRMNLLQQKQMMSAEQGQAPDLSLNGKINDLGKEVDQLGATATFTPPTISYAAPNLAKYNYDTAAPVDNSDPNGAGLTSNVGPFWSLLNGQKKQTGAFA